MMPIVAYANEQNDFVIYLEPKLAKPHISKRSYAGENEIVYLVEDAAGRLSAKLAKKNGEITTGGIDEEASQLSDYRIKLPTITNGNFSITLDTTLQQDRKCHEVQFSFEQKYAYLSQLPNSLDTATHCKFLLHGNGSESKNINILMNYSYKKWCNLNTDAEATKTAKRINSSCDTNYVKSLTALNMSGQFLEDKNKTRDISSLSGIRKLKELDLRVNLLTSIPQVLLAGLKELETLWLHRNQITNLEYGTFVQNTKLKELALSYNNLTRVPHGLLNGLKELETLYLNNNQLTQLSLDTFVQNTKLKELHLSNNNFTSIPPGLLNGLKELETLRFDGNQITNLDRDAFKKNHPKLTDLQL